MIFFIFHHSPHSLLKIASIISQNHIKSKIVLSIAIKNVRCTLFTHSLAAAITRTEIHMRYRV